MVRTYTRREALALGGGALAASALAACGSTGAAKVASPHSSPANSSQKGRVSLLYDWTYNGPAGGVSKYWHTVQRRLAANKGGLELSNLSETTFNNLFPSVSASISAKSGSDIATYYSDYSTYQLAYLSEIQPIGAAVSKSTRSHWLVNQSSLFDGKYWGYPLVMEIAVLAVNRRLLDKAGVNVGKQFESYSDFIDACDKLKAAGITPIRAGTSDGFNAEKWLYFMMFQKCNNITDFVEGILGNTSLDTPFFAFPREQLSLLAHEYMNPAPENDTEQIAINKFLQGEGAMMMMYLTPLSAKGVPSEFQVVGIPKAPVKFNRPFVGVSDNLITFTYADRVDLAGEFFDFLAEPEQVQLWWDLNGTLPASDQLDASVLPSQARQVWDLIQPIKNVPFAMWWPGNQVPSALFTFQYGITQGLLSGAYTPAQAKSAAAKLFSTWRDQNPAGVKVLAAYGEALAKTAGITPA